jgi:hypothetical protein
MRSQRVSTLNNSGGFMVVKKTTSGAAIAYQGSAGMNNTSLTSGFAFGVYFTQTGFSIYNAYIGIATVASFTYTGASNYTSMFDQYRILRVKVTGYWSANVGQNGNANLGTPVPLMYTAIDFDGAAPGVINTAQNVLTYQNSQAHQPGTLGRPIFTRTLQPRVVLDLTQYTGAPVGTAPAGQWVDCGNATVPHYGLLMGYDNMGASSTLTESYLNLVVETEYEYRGDRA